jgi:signal transduction histidine kinase
VSEILEGMRVKLAKLGKHVGAIVIDRGGKVIGGVAIDGQPAERSALVSEAWRALPAGGDGEHAASGSRDDAVELLFGAAEVSHPRVAWSVVLLEPAREALAPVRRMRDRWIAVTAGLLLAGLALATLLARQVMRPLDEVTRATSRVASHPDLDLPLLPVRSRNEVGELAESFNKMAVELKRSHTEALSAAKFAFAGELAAMVAHEIRTPLSVMRSSAQMLTGDTGAGAARNAELVDSIVAEVDRIERVVTGLIQLASPLEQRPEPTPLADVLSRAAAFARAQAKRLQIEITCDVAGGAPPALCDREQIYQVVLNLLVNALQALPPGGHVELRTLAEDSGTVGFAVGDDGPGLPAAIRDRVFLPFVTGRAEGTGLGLAFVDRIVKAHHGSVSVHSECGQGTVFEVRLPAAVAPR